jgi:hypothetical protein
MEAKDRPPDEDREAAAPEPTHRTGEEKARKNRQEEPPA